MNKHNLLIAVLLSITSLSATAKQNDLMQEVKISAASQEADIKNNQMIFNGPVEVTQGSIKILADELRASSKEGSGGKILIATGKPATYTQVMEDGRPATASADEIRYELSNRTLTLIGHATLEQDGSQVKGDKIRYNIAEQQLIAESKGNERVITIIQPENYQETEQTETKKVDPQPIPTQLPEIDSNSPATPVQLPEIKQVQQ